MYRCIPQSLLSCCFFFFTAPAPPALYTLSLHDALPISGSFISVCTPEVGSITAVEVRDSCWIRTKSHRIASCVSCSMIDRKSTRLNSSHRCISYAVFCLKKKSIENDNTATCNENQHSLG